MVHYIKNHLGLSWLDLCCKGRNRAVKVSTMIKFLHSTLLLYEYCYIKDVFGVSSLPSSMMLLIPAIRSHVFFLYIAMLSTEELLPIVNAVSPKSYPSLT